MLRALPFFDSFYVFSCLSGDLNSLRQSGSAHFLHVDPKRFVLIFKTIQSKWVHAFSCLLTHSLVCRSAAVSFHLEFSLLLFVCFICVIAVIPSYTEPSIYKDGDQQKIRTHLYMNRSRLCTHQMYAHARETWAGKNIPSWYVLNLNWDERIYICYA